MQNPAAIIAELVRLHDEAVATLRNRRDVPEGTPLVIFSDIFQIDHAVNSILLDQV